MRWKDLLCLFHSPYSSWGLRYRADRLSDNPETRNLPYQQFLYAVASAIDAKKISEFDAKKAVEYFRTGNEDLMSVARKLIGEKR